MATTETYLSYGMSTSKIIEAILEAHNLLLTHSTFSHFDCYAYPFQTFNQTLFLESLLSYFLKHSELSTNRRVCFLFQTPSQNMFSIILEFKNINIASLKKIKLRFNTVGLVENELKRFFMNANLWFIGANNKTTAEPYSQIFQTFSAEYVETNNHLAWMVQTLSYLQTGEENTRVTEETLENYRQYCLEAFLQKLDALQHQAYYVELTTYIQKFYKIWEVQYKIKKNYSIKPSSLTATKKIKAKHQETLNNFYSGKNKLKDILDKLKLEILSESLLQLKKPLVWLEKLKKDCKDQVNEIEKLEKKLQNQERMLNRLWLPYILDQAQNSFYFLLMKGTRLAHTMLLINWLGNFFPVIPKRMQQQLFPLITLILSAWIALKIEYNKAIKDVARALTITIITQGWLNFRSICSRDLLSLSKPLRLRFHPKAIRLITPLLVASTEALLTQTYSPLLLMIAAMGFSISTQSIAQRYFSKSLSQKDLLVLSFLSYPVGYSLAGYALNYGAFIYNKWSLCQSMLGTVKMHAQKIKLPYHKARCTGLTNWSFWFKDSNPLELKWVTQDNFFYHSACQVDLHKTVIPTTTAGECQLVMQNNIDYHATLQLT